MRFFTSSALALAAAMGFAQSSHAQDAVQTDASLSDEIVVTVQKREQAVLDVPIAVSAFDDTFLDRVGITKFDELALFVPGLEIQEQSPNNPGFVIRGVTSDSGESTIEPRVAVFQDGVSLSRSRGSYVELFDMERIEVAKGPQATLFGRGALIGGINLIQKKADVSDFGGDVSVSAGDYDFFRGYVAVNAPIVEDKLGVRVAYTRRARDGATTNLTDGTKLGGADTEAMRVALRFEPTPTLRFDVIVNHQTDENDGTSFKSGTFAPIGGNTSPFTPASLNTFGNFEGGRPIGLDRRVDSATVLGAWDFSERMSLSSITGYRFFKSFETFDPDGFQYPVTIFGEEAKGNQWSQELRLNFEATDRLSGFVGASYFYEDGSQRLPLSFDERAVLGLLTGFITRPNPQPYAVITNGATLQALLGGIGVPAASRPVLASLLKPLHSETVTNYGETKAVDIYGDLTFAVTERLEVSGGVRYTQDDKTTGGASALVNGGSILGSLLAGVAPGTPVGLFTQPSLGVARRSETFDDVTWRVVARYAPTENTSVWASLARGRRPDVISVSAPSTPFGATRFNVLPAETADSYEVGAKGRFLGGALDLDGSVFYYQYENFQTTEFTGVQLITTNAGEATALGFEGAVSYQPNAHIDLFANYAYNDATLDTGARKGNRFRLSPENSVAVGGTFSVTVGSLGMLSFTPTYTWQSEIFFDDDNDRSSLQIRTPGAFSDTLVNEKQESYGLVNLRGGFTPANTALTFGAFVTNAADEDYIIDAGNTGDILGIPTFIRGAPRTVGLEVKASF